MVGQCLDLPLFLQKFVIFGGKSAWWENKKWLNRFFSPHSVLFIGLLKPHDGILSNVMT